MEGAHRNVLFYSVDRNKILYWIVLYLLLKYTYILWNCIVIDENMKKIINEFLFKFLSKCYFKQIKTYLINKKKTTANDYKFNKICGWKTTATKKTKYY